MANHTHDCEFCGDDQRLNAACCAEQVTKRASEEKRVRDKDDAARKVLERHGIRGTRPISLWDVAMVIERLENRIHELSHL